MRPIALPDCLSWFLKKKYKVDHPWYSPMGFRRFPAALFPIQIARYKNTCSVFHTEITRAYEHISPCEMSMRNFPAKKLNRNLQCCYFGDVPNIFQSGFRCEFFLLLNTVFCGSRHVQDACTACSGCARIVPT